MLRLTDNAVAMIRDMTTKPELPAETGLRIAAESGDPASLFLIMVDGPVPGDETIEKDGARIFLDPGAAPAVTGKILDVRADGGGAVQFSLNAP